MQSNKIETKYVCSAVDAETYEKTKDIVKYVKKNRDMKIYSIEDVYSYVCFATDEVPKPYFNIFLQGNLGSKSPIEILKSIEGQKNAFIYIYHDEKKVFWQTPLEARKYIRDNYQLMEQCGIFDIYKVR